MSYTAPTSPAVGDQATAAWAGIIAADIAFLANPPILLCTQATAQSVATSTGTALLLDTTVVDTIAGHSTVTNTSRYTPNVAGYYRITASVMFASNATGYREIYLAKNGTQINDTDRRAPAISGAQTTLDTSSIIQLNGSTDYVEAWVFQNSGGALLTQGGNYPALRAQWIHT